MKRTPVPCCHHHSYLRATFSAYGLYVTLSHICRINKQYVWFAHKQNVILPEFDKINVITQLLNVKYHFASVPVLDLADIHYFHYNVPLHGNL